MLGGTAPLHTQTLDPWETVYSSNSGGFGGPCGDVGADAFGNVFAVGRANVAAGSSVALVIGSGDGGANWELLDQYYEPGLSYSYHRAFAADPTVPGHLFAGGNLNNLLLNGSYEFDTLWIIRERDPETGLWDIAEDYSDIKNDVGQSSCADILVTPNGDVYATGGSQPGWGLGWLVRKRMAGESAFSTADVDYSGQSAGSGLNMAFHPTLGVIVVGYVNNVWTVRYSVDGTGTFGSWDTLDSFQTKTRKSWEWAYGTPNGVAVTQLGEIYVAGRAYYFGDSKYHWIVRRSMDNGTTWSIFDDYMPSGASLAEAFGIVTDAEDNVYVCGRLLDSNGYHWIVRRTQWAPHTTTTKIKGKTTTETTYIWEFATSDSFQVEKDKNSRANAITIDAEGNVFVGGSGLDARDVQRFVVRKLSR